VIVAKKKKANLTGRISNACFGTNSEKGELSLTNPPTPPEADSEDIKQMNMLKPLADRVLIQPAPAEEKTASGIIIPDTAKEKPLKGVVIAVGPGKKDEPMTVKAKDKVLYGQYSGTEIKLDGKTYLIMRESDIYGII
jgi:chaperonin GroES